MHSAQKCARNKLIETKNASISSESDSDLESIPPASHFKQRKSSKSSQSNNVVENSDDKNKATRRSFGNDGYIEGKWLNNRLVEIDFCQFTSPISKNTVYVRKQSPGYLLTYDQEDFVARVCFDKLEELEFSSPSKIKLSFSKKLQIREIIRDKLLNDRFASYEMFIQLLQHNGWKTAKNVEYAEDFFQLSKIIEGRRKRRRKIFDNIEILKSIVKNENISHETKHVSQQLFNREQALDVRRKEFSYITDFNTVDLLTPLQRICKEGIINHTNYLHRYYQSIFVKVPSVIDHLSGLNDKSILYVSYEDVGFFADLLDMMKEQPFLDLVVDTWNSLFKRIRNIRNELQVSSSLKSFVPLTHPIYFYLCKSFKELILEISSKTDIPAKNLLYKNKQGKWVLLKTITWPTTSYQNCSLEKQYRFIFELMTHFEPGYYSDKKQFVLDSQAKRIKKKINSTIPEGRLAWIYILDIATTDLFSKEENLKKSFEYLIQCYTDFIENTKGDHYESFRIATHNVLRFIAKTGPYYKHLKNDHAILSKQVEFIKNAFSDNPADSLRHLVDTYNEYWENRESILEKNADKFPYGKFKKDMEEIRLKLFNIVNTVLDKKVTAQVLVKYFRSFNEFLEDLNCVEFSWFIKETNNLTEVKLVNSDKKSYKVLNPENFIKTCDNIPKHYLIEITQELLNSVSNLLTQKKWPDDDNVDAASELLSAIKKSLLYLKEQPNYLSFYIFKEESTAPFTYVVQNSSSYEDFKKRVYITGESIWYLRIQDEIDIEKALKLYRTVNMNTNSKEDTLKNCFNRYLARFNFYIQKTVNEEVEKKIKIIAEEVRKQSEQIKINEWKSEFKRDSLPELLAGLAAVWSIQESKDVASTGKILNTHCIQILCILQLLSVDKDSKGVDNHLTQVSTGQGKSLVLGLLSSLLALTGHKVRTVCYSEYLATRDQQNFHSFFKNFGICDKITYGTFKEMANEMIMPEINGKKQCLKLLVTDRILNHSAKQTGEMQQRDVSNTILLIDEVDVFFSDKYYGNIYSAYNTIVIPGLCSIQEKIWEMACKCYGKSTIMKELEELVYKKVAERDQNFKELNKFQYKPGKYYLLKEEGNMITKREYTNQSLYQEHLEEMIDVAIKVAKGGDKNWYINDFKINDEGIISYRQDDGYYSTCTYHSYYNVFNYLRLKVINYSHKRYGNYGYININCGYVSYAKLPEKYPLILGVTGTLTTLDDHEKKVVRESYNIQNISIMPNFFGDSHLKFDSSRDIIFEDSEEQWLGKIFNHTNSKISSGQSVLVFFDTDVQINKFTQKFLGKFDRMHTITENTEEVAKEKYIDGTGIAKTITLATRGMGRGIDFKSSVAVEQAGGVHLIQTFFSIDIKEETQIKGRTARKDNKGSYELILCKEHLINAGFLKNEEKSALNYNSLIKSRERNIEQKVSNNKIRIKESDINHNATMDFLESFFKKVCN